jgi:hypothetical protein
MPIRPFFPPIRPLSDIFGLEHLSLLGEDCETYAERKQRIAKVEVCFELEAFIVFLGFGIADAQTSSNELPEQEGYSIAPFAQRSQSPCWQPPQGLLQSQDRPRHGRSGAYRRLSSLVVAGSSLMSLLKQDCLPAPRVGRGYASD